MAWDRARGRLSCLCMRVFFLEQLRSLFYVTECEAASQEVFFFRKPVWAKFRSVCMCVRAQVLAFGWKVCVMMEGLCSDGGRV